MPRVHFVKKARKDNRVAKKGESYYWWSPMTNGRGGGKRYSKEKPKPSQVTQSEFWSAVYSLQEDMEEAKPSTIEELQDMLEGWKSEVSEIRDRCQEKYDNLPEGLQAGQSGETQQGRIDAMDDWEQQLDAIDIDTDAEDKEAAIETALDEIRQISVDCE